MVKRIIFIFMVVVIALTSVFVVAKKLSSDLRSPTNNKLKIITTLFPLYDFAKNIGGNRVDVTLLLPPGVESHSFEPKPSDIIAINQGDVFVYTGKFMEVWVDDILKGTTNKNLKVVDASYGIKLLPTVLGDEDKQKGSNDPHIWLDFTNAQTMVDNIALALIEKDSPNSSFYMQNATSLKERIREIDGRYRTAFISCKSREIIYGGHYTFGYPAKRYGLTYKAAQGLAPDSEPTANDLASLVSQIRKNNIDYIFYEELSSPKIAETLARETNTKMLLLNAAHNVSKKDLEDGVSYLFIMERNLANLKIGLGCQ
jgi:zinc transport system substrate-binding protein